MKLTFTSVPGRAQTITSKELPDEVRLAHELRDAGIIVDRVRMMIRVPFEDEFLTPRERLNISLLVIRHGFERINGLQD